MSLAISGGYKSLILTFTEPQNTYYVDDSTTPGTAQKPITAARTDIDKLYIWVGTTTGFTPSNNNLVYSSGYQPSVIIDKFYNTILATPALTDFEDNISYFVKYAITSKLEPDLQVISSEYIGTTRNIDGEVSLRPWILVTSNYLAGFGDRIMADTSAGTFTITLPANPAIGSTVTITDAGNFVTNPLIVARNGSLMVGKPEDIELDILNTTFEFIYVGGTKGWDFTTTTGPKGDDGIPAELLKLKLSDPSFIYADYKTLDTLLPKEITITAELQNIQGIVAFTAQAYAENGTLLGTVTLLPHGTDPNSRILTAVNFNTISGVSDRTLVRYVKITAELEDLSDTERITRLDNGSEAILHRLSNYSVSLISDSYGKVASYGAATVKGYVERGSINETMDWTITKTDSLGLSTTLVTPIKISTKGIIGGISGTGPWTAVIADMSSTTGLAIGDTISAIESKIISTGKLYTGNPISVVVTAKTSTSVTYTVTGGGSPVAGVINGVCKGPNNYTLSVTALSDSINDGVTTLTATKDNRSYDVNFTVSKSIEGITPVTIDLTNDHHGITADVDGSNGDYSLAITDVNLLVGDISGFPNITNLTITPTPATGVTFSYTKNGVLTSNLTSSTSVSLSPPISTLSIAITNIVNNIDTARLRVSATYDGVVYSADFTVNKGKDGNEAVVYTLESDNEIVFNPNTDLFTPSTVKYSAYSKTGAALRVPYINANGVIRLEYSVNNIQWTAIGTDQQLTSQNFRTFSTNVLPLNTKYLRYTFLINNSVVDVETDNINLSGTNASTIVVDVENDSHGIPFKTSGGSIVSTGLYTYSGTKIQVFENTSELQYVKGTPVAGEWTIAGTTSSGIQCSIDSSATNKPSAVGGQKWIYISDHSNMTSDTATITYNITAVTAKGVTITNIFGNQTFNKNLNSGIYRIVGAGSIVRNKAGIFSSLTVEGQFVQENNIVNGFGFLTQTPNNGTESAVSAGSITIQPAQYSTTTSITVKLYDTAAKTNLLDLADIKVVTDGFDPIIVDVKNDAHLIPSDSTGIVSSYLYSGGIIQVFENTAELQYVGPSATLNRQQWKITAVNGKNITPGNIPTLADSGQKYVTFPDHSNMTSNTASITYTISAKNTNDQIITGIVGGQTFTKSFTTAIFRIINATTIRVDDFGNVIQAVVNAQKIDKEVTTSPFGWITEQLDNGSISARVQLTSTGYTTKAIKTTKKVTIRLYETQTSTLLLDTAEIQVISDGISPSVFNVDVENDSHGIPFARTSTGTYTGVYNYSGTKIQVFENTSELQYVKGTPTIGQWTIASTTSSGIQCSIDSSATNKPSAVSGQKYATVSDHSNMTSDTATITYNITAVTAKGVTITNIFGNQTFNKSTSPGIYRIVGAATIVVEPSGVVNNVVVTGQLFSNTDIISPAGYLSQQLDNGSESSRVQSLTTSALSTTGKVIVRLYDAQLGGTLVDTAQINVVKSGSSGQSVDIIFTRVAAGVTPTISNSANPPTSSNATWTTTVPTGSNPLWSSTGYSNSPYTTWTWDTPVRVTGETVVEVTAFIRSNAATVATPTGGSYDFTTNVLTPPSGWSKTIPSGEAAVWESRAVITTTSPNPTWSTPVRINITLRTVDIIGIVSIKFDPAAASKYSPSSISLQASTTNLIGTVSYSWTSSSTGITISNASSQNATLTFTGTDTSTKTITLTVTDSVGTLTKTLTIPIVESAFNNISINYSNDSHNVPTIPTINWLGSGGVLEIREGQTLLTLNSTSLTASYPSGTGRYNLSISRISGDTLSVGSISGSTQTTIGEWSGNLTQVTVYRITAYVNTLAGNTLTIPTDVTLTPVKDTAVYRIFPSVGSISKNPTNNVLTPNNFTVTLYRAIGNTVETYSGRFILQSSTDGSNWTNFYTTTSDVSSLNVSGWDSSSVGIKIKAYLAGGTSTLIDEEVVAIITQGTQGTKGDQGIQGPAAKGIDLSSNHSAFKLTGASYSPTSATLTVTPQNLTSPSYAWSVSAGANLNTYSGTTVTLTPTSNTSIITVSVIATDSGQTYSKSLSFGVFKDGIGQDGRRTASGYVYYQSASPSPPNGPGASSFTISTSTFYGLSGGWSNQAPTFTDPNGKYWAASYTATENSPGSNSASGTNLQFGSVIQTLGFSGLVTFTALNTPGQTTINGSNITTGTIKADIIDTRGLTIKDAYGNVIFGAGVYPSNLDNANVTANSIGAIPTSSLGSLQNSNISISIAGALQGIGSGAGTLVSNNSITIDNSGQIQGIGSGSGTTVSNNNLSLTASSNGSIILNRGNGTNATLNLSSAGISSMAYIQKLTKDNLATYMDTGIVRNAFIGNIISSTNFDGQFDENTGVIYNDGTTGWAIGKAGTAVFNNIYARGRLDVGNNDKYLRFSGGTLTVKGNIVCDTLTANNLITTNMIKQNQVSNIITASYIGAKAILWFNDNTTYGYLWPFNTRGIAVGPAVIIPESGSKILINWSTQYYAARHEYNLIEIWRLINYGYYWATQRLYYLGSQPDINNQAAHGLAYRIQGEEVASGAFVDTSIVSGLETAYFLIVGNNAGSFTYVMNPYLSLTELKR